MKIKLSVILFFVSGFCFFLLGSFSLSAKKQNTDNSRLKTTLFFDVYNHTQGYIKSFKKKDVQIGSDVSLSISEIVVKGVDKDRIVIRGCLSNCRYIASGYSGMVIFSVMEKHKELYNFHYTVFLMNTSNNANYKLLDKQNASLRFPPHTTYHRGIDRFPKLKKYKNRYIESLNKAINQINGSLKFSWITYGSFKEVNKNGNIDISFAMTEKSYDSRYGWGGYDGKKWFIKIRSNLWEYPPLIQAFCIEEIVELICRFEDIGGTESYWLLTNFRYTGPWTILITAKGRDLIVYVYVKSPKTINQFLKK